MKDINEIDVMNAINLFVINLYNLKFYGTFIWSGMREMKNELRNTQIICKILGHLWWCLKAWRKFIWFTSIFNRWFSTGCGTMFIGSLFSWRSSTIPSLLSLSIFRTAGTNLSNPLWYLKKICPMYIQDVQYIYIYNNLRIFIIIWTFKYWKNRVNRKQTETALSNLRKW